MSNLTKVGLGLLVLSIATLWIYEGTKGDQAKRDEELQKMQRVAVGSVAKLTLDPKQKSIDGYHQISGVTVWFRPNTSAQVKLEATTPRQKPWPDPIEVKTVTVKGMPVAAYDTQAVEPYIEVPIPKDVKLVGQKATMDISGTVTFPTVKEVAGRTFDVKEVPFKQTLEVLIVATEAEEKKPPLPAIYGIVGFGVIISGLLLVIALIRKM